MKLNLEQIKCITQGAERIEEIDGVIRFFRFTAEERAVYSPAEHFDQITGATAGIQMVFQTDATALALKVHTSKATNRSFFCHDIFVNDRLVGCLRNFTDEIRNTAYSRGDFPLGMFQDAFALGNGLKTVRIVFPWSVVSGLVNMELKDGNFITPVFPEKRILMYGDSITQGYDSLNPSNAYSLRLARDLGAMAMIKAIGGQVFRPELADIRQKIAPDYITVAYGTNDWTRLQSFADFEANCKAFFQNLQKHYPAVKTLIITPIWREDCEKTDGVICPFSQIESVITESAKILSNAVIVSGNHLVPHDTENLADRWVHPNDSGFAHYYQNLQKHLSKVKL